MQPAVQLVLAIMLSPQVQSEVAVVWTGSDSNVPKEGIKLILDQESWIRTWFENKGDNAALNELGIRKIPGTVEKDLGYFTTNRGVPTINFRTHCVLALFGGRAESTLGYSVHSTSRMEGQLILRIQRLGLRYPHSTNRVLRAGAKGEKSAYGFFVLPRNFRQATVYCGSFEGVEAGYKVLGTLELNP